MWLFRAARFVCLVLVVACCACNPTNVTYCTPDETMCHGSCAPLYKDPANCGACDVACAEGFVCSDGACATSCGAGTSPCGQSCVELSSDRSNCGACGTACPPFEACVNGTCSTTCDNEKLCVAGEAAYCASTLSDNANCGDCGVACGPETSCIDGVCKSSCVIGQTLCDYCTDLTNDPFHCGSCTNACATGQYCEASQCVCPTGMTVCKGVCVDFGSDDANCGSCGRTCTGGTCADAVCTISIATPTADVVAIALGTSYVYWLEATGDLYRATTLGKQQTQLASSVTATSIAVDGSNVYWPSGDAIDFVPIGGGNVSTQSLAVGEGAREVVADGYDVYVAGTDVVSFPSGGGDVTTIVSSEPTPHSLAIENGVLFWANSQNELRRVQTDGTGLQTITTTSSAIGDLATDGVNVYFAWNDDDILAIAANGIGPTLALTTNANVVARVVTDGANVYFIDATTVSKIPTMGGATSLLATTTASALAIDTGNVFWTTSSDIMRREAP